MRFFTGALLAMLIPSATFALTDDEIRAQIAELLGELTSIQAQLQLQQSNPVPVIPVAQPAPAPVQMPSTPIPGSLPYCPSLIHSFGRGVSGSEVAALQRFLIAAGFLNSSSVTGYFGELTEKALQGWQAEHGVVTSGTPDTTGFGYLGARTKAAIVQNCSGSETGIAGATLRVTPSGSDAKVILVDATVNTANACGGSYLIEYGDGLSDTIQLPNTVCNSFTQRLPHTYKTTGTYSVVITSGKLRVEVPITLAGTNIVSCKPPVFTIPSIETPLPNYPFTLPLLSYMNDASNPTSVSATGLPQGLKLTDQTSLSTSSAQTVHSWSIAGYAPSIGNYPLTISASNNCGSATANITLPVGAPTQTQSAICPNYTYPTCATGYHVDYRPSGTSCSAMPICVADTTTSCAPRVNVDCAIGYHYTGDTTDTNGCQVRGQCVPN